MPSTAPFVPGQCYHIFNRGNNREDLFREERNYRYFLRLYAHHVEPVVDTFAYCLLKNHFHLLVRIKERQTSQGSTTCEVSKGAVVTPRAASQAFSNFFNAYTKAINKAYERTGSLFQEHFGRIAVTSDAYFAHLIFYIHFNPQKHGFVPDFRDWTFSSYHALASERPTRLARDTVIGWYGSAARFEEFHRGQVDERAVRALIPEDWE